MIVREEIKLVAGNASKALAGKIAKYLGIELTDGNAFGFQGHPEASPGPHDVSPLFDRFIDMMKTGRG